MEIEGSSLVFVYGTLKRGFPLHQSLLGAEFLATAKTVPAYFLVDCYDYPGLRHASDSQSGQAIVGEVFRVNSETLQQLDEVECVSEDLYQRDLIQLAAPFESERIWAWFYVSDQFDQRIVGECWVC